MTTILLALAAFFLAFANGANDNFKGVATLYGSGTRSFKSSLNFANFTTLLGSLASLLLAQALVAKFSGKGLVPDGIVGDPNFALAVAAAAAGTVLLATRFGFPVSTTHALMGSLVGAGMAASPQGLNWAALGQGFVKPLVLSPVMALGGALLIYPTLRHLRKRFGIEKDSCFCVVEGAVGVPANSALWTPSPALPALTTGRSSGCASTYSGTLPGVEAHAVLDGLHALSAGLVSFSRGLNDTPKIAALLMLAGLGAPGLSIALVGAGVLLGGWLGGRRVAETVSHRITALNPGQGFSANLVTSTLVIGASLLGNPVSTTHVSCGALFGIGTATGLANWKSVAGIVASWVVTLPLAALLAFAAASSLKLLGM